MERAVPRGGVVVLMDAFDRGFMTMLGVAAAVGLTVAAGFAIVGLGNALKKMILYAHGLWRLLRKKVAR